jgi:Ca2+-binding RTX toxin-like protein
MANITSVGNVSGLLSLPDSFGDSMVEALEDHFDNFITSIVAVGNDLVNDNYTPLSASSTSVKLHLLGALGDLTVFGTGLTSDLSGGSLTGIQFEGDNALNWRIDGNVSSSTGILTKLAFWNDAHTEDMTIEGKFKEGANGDPTGTMTKMTLVHDGVTFVLTGKFNLDDIDGGKFAGLTMSDGSGNSASISGKISMAAVLNAEGSLFDDPGVLSGKDVFNVADGTRTWYGFGGADTMNGGALADSLDGGADKDKLFGMGGDDALVGGSGDDAIDGGSGNDTIVSGAGKDKVTGGSGSDRFVFDNLASGGVDTINDFNAAEDELWFDESVFLSLAGGISADELVFAVKPVAGDANDFLLLDSAGGKLYYDADGNGAGAAILIATVKGSLTGLDADELVAFTPTF